MKGDPRPENNPVCHSNIYNNNISELKLNENVVKLVLTQWKLDKVQLFPC